MSLSKEDELEIDLRVMWQVMYGVIATLTPEQRAAIANGLPAAAARERPFFGDEGVARFHAQGLKLVSMAKG